MEIDEFTVAFPSSKRQQLVHSVRNPPGLYPHPLPSLFFVSVDSKGNELVCFYQILSVNSTRVGTTKRRRDPRCRRKAAPTNEAMLRGCVSWRTLRIVHFVYYNVKY